MDDEGLLALIIVMVMVVSAMITTTLFIPEIEKANVYDAAKAECEQELPRDQECVMYFKVEDS